MSAAPTAASGCALIARGKDGPAVSHWHCLLQALHVAHERLEVLVGELVGLHVDLRLLGELGLHRLRIRDPEGDVCGRQLLADPVERELLVALARDGVAGLALVGRVHGLALLDVLGTQQGGQADERGKDRTGRNSLHVTSPSRRRTGEILGRPVEVAPSARICDDPTMPAGKSAVTKNAGGE